MTDRRIQKSQDAIKDAFIQLMAEKDFNQITIQDITTVANIGRRTFYHHYLDKYDLLSTLIEERLSDLKTICTNQTTHTELIWFDYFEEHYQFFATMIAGKGQFAFRRLFLEFIMEELKKLTHFSHGLNKDIDEAIYLKFFGSAIVGVIEDYFMKNEPNTSTAFAHQVMLLLTRNL